MIYGNISSESQWTPLFNPGGEIINRSKHFVIASSFTAQFIESIDRL